MGVHCNVKNTVYTIIFAYRYFHGFGPGAEIRKDFSDVFIIINRFKLKWKFLRGLTCEIHENITTYTVTMKEETVNEGEKLQPLKHTSECMEIPTFIWYIMSSLARVLRY